MIKAEDLRIGDLVMVIHDCAFPKGTMCAVTQIDHERVHKDKKGVVTLSYTDGTDNVGLEGTTYWYHGLANSSFRTPQEAYASIIDRISGKGTWASNPYVFVYEFKLTYK